jgi:co-chaperonin GroES (HSP10)
MKLDKDLFPVNMNMVELNENKVLVRLSQAESTKEKGVIIGEERPPRMIKPKNLKGGQWQKNEGGKQQQHLKATFDILMAKYKEGRAGIRGHENRTIRNIKANSPVSLGQASTSTAGSLSGKRSRTPPR